MAIKALKDITLAELGQYCKSKSSCIDCPVRLLCVDFEINTVDWGIERSKDLQIDIPEEGKLVNDG